jgi:hypothetical protein
LEIDVVDRDWIELAYEGYLAHIQENHPNEITSSVADKIIQDLMIFTTTNNIPIDQNYMEVRLADYQSKRSDKDMDLLSFIHEIMRRLVDPNNEEHCKLFTTLNTLQKSICKPIRE